MLTMVGVCEGIHGCSTVKGYLAVEIFLRLFLQAPVGRNSYGGQCSLATCFVMRFFLLQDGCYVQLRIDI
jgi:hypothetical protein